MPKKAKHHLGMSAMAASMILTGLVVVLNKVILEDVSSIQLNSLRFSISLLFMVSLMRFRPVKVNAKQLGLIVLKAGLNVAKFILFYLGLQRLDASLASILTAMIPLLIYFGAVRYLHEKARNRVLVGLILALVGATIISLTEDGKIGQFIDALGFVYISSSIVLTAITTLMSKSLVTHINPKAIMKANMAIMTLGFWMLVGFSGQWPSNISSTNWLLILVSSFMLYVIYVLYYQSLKYVKAEDTGVVSYLQYLAGIVGAIIFLGERPVETFWLGASLIVIGILIAETNVHIKQHRKLHLHYLRHHK